MDTFSCNRYCFLKSRQPLTKKPEFSKDIKLVLFDMDGVLVDSISSWRHVHNYFSTNNDNSVDAYVKGRISDEEFIRRDVSNWKKNDKFIKKEYLQSIFSSIKLMKGSQQCIHTLRKNGVQLGIVSAGVDVLANTVAQILNISMVYSNQLHTDSTGRLTGEGMVHVPLMNKDIVVRQIVKRFNLSQSEIAAIGNSCFDIPLLRSVGYGIAFHPSDECIVKEADVVIRKKDLSEIIPSIEPFIK